MKPAESQTAAANAARRRQSGQKLTRVEKVIGQLQREGTRVTVRAIARRAGVSSTFLYENPAARALVHAATTASQANRDNAAGETHDRIEATWRERALNAEEALTRTQNEVRTQRLRIGELMGQIRDIDQTAPGESLQRLITENASLKQQIRQLTQEHRSLQERLEAARSNSRFAERRIAALEAQLLDPPTPRPPT